jgi:ribosomal-protein-alanine N-acetyltransferase
MRPLRQCQAGSLALRAWCTVQGMALPRCIDTPRLVLRDPRPADAEALFTHALGSAEVLRLLGLRPHPSVADTRQHISHDIHRWLKQSGWLWVLALPSPDAPDGMAIGQIELTPMSHPGASAHHLRLGYVLGRPWWGQGHMSEAVDAVLQAAMAQPPVWRVDALCDEANTASARLLARVGMQREGLLRKVVMHPNAAAHPRDAWLYARTREARETLVATPPHNGVPDVTEALQPCPTTPPCAT